MLLVFDIDAWVLLKDESNWEELYNRWQASRPTDRQTNNGQAMWQPCVWSANSGQRFLFFFFGRRGRDGRVVCRKSYLRTCQSCHVVSVFFLINLTDNVCEAVLPGVPIYFFLIVKNMKVTIIVKVYYDVYYDVSPFLYQVHWFLLKQVIDKRTWIPTL